MSLTPIGRTIVEHFACEHSDAVLSRVPTANGEPDRITMWCRACKAHVAKSKGFPGIWIARSHPELVGVDVDALPVAYSLVEYRRCQGPCRKLTRCEFHHLAPRKFFGDEADEWPTAWLCQDCHDRWHTLVTPGLCTAYDAVVHARQLLDYLGTDRAARLTLALTKQGSARRAEEAA